MFVYFQMLMFVSLSEKEVLLVSVAADGERDSVEEDASQSKHGVSILTSIDLAHDVNSETAIFSVF